MSREPPIDALDSESMRGEIVTQVAFHEFIVEGADGEEKWFDAKQSGQVAAFIKTCALPVRITLSFYVPGSGMTFVYRRNRRRSNMTPAPVPSTVIFYEGLPANKAARRELGRSLIAKGLKHTIVAALIGIKPTSVYAWGKGRESMKRALQTATVAVYGPA